MPVAWGIETYHNHTLLHDDLMDNADVRRGRPTVHKKWNENTAILSGDTMLIRSFRLLLEANCERKEELLDLVSRTMIEVCEGQQYDVNFESRTDVSEEQELWRQMLPKKNVIYCIPLQSVLVWLFNFRMIIWMCMVMPPYLEKL